ncbi:MAG: hypothetical protein ABIN35_00940 [candidate division WOR-3 bacterium]
MDQLVLNYRKLLNLINNLDHDQPNQKTLQLHQALTLINDKIDQLNQIIQQLLSDTLVLTEQEQQEYREIEIVQNSIKLLTPYILYLNLYQSLNANGFSLTQGNS